MRLVIQRVTHASVTVDQEVIGKIEKGFLVLMGVGASDDEAMDISCLFGTLSKRQRNWALK